MKRLTYLLVLISAAFVAVPVAQMSPVAGATMSVRHTIIAASGDAAPVGGNFGTFSFNNVRLNARHEVAFDAFLTGPPPTFGVFAGDGTRTSTIALGVNPDPAGPSFGFPSNPFIAPNGDVVFQSNFSDIFRSDGKRIVPLVHDGDQAPGGGTLTPTSSFVANDHGEVAYGAFISGATASQGIFRVDGRTDGTVQVTIARDDISPPTGGSFITLGDPVMNDRGQVAFFSEMTGGSGDFGIFRGEGGDLTAVFVANQVAPGGATFQDFGNPLINTHGQIAALASLANSTSPSGVFVGNGSDAVAIALDGQTAPKGGTYRDRSGRGDTFVGPIRFNDQGEVAFAARLSGGTPLSGLFRSNGDRTATIALAGTIAPGTTGAFQSFDDFLLLNDGRVAFIATLAAGAGGVDASNNRGIWIGTSDENLQLVVRTGDAIGGKLLTRLPTFLQGHQFDMNESDVLWVGSFGSAKAIVLSRVN